MSCSMEPTVRSMARELTVAVEQKSDSFRLFGFEEVLDGLLDGF